MALRLPRRALVVFDKDGTLVSFRPWLHWAVSALGSLARVTSDDAAAGAAARIGYCPKARDVVSSDAPLACADLATLEDALASSFPPGLSWARARARATWVRREAARWDPLQRAVGAHLRRAMPTVRVAMCTSDTRAGAKQCARDTALSFDFVLSSSDPEWRPKPDPAPLLDALAGVGDLSRVWYVGDTRADMQLAAAAGVVGVGVLTGAGTAQELRAAGAGAVVPSVLHLAEEGGSPTTAQLPPRALPPANGEILFASDDWSPTLRKDADVRAPPPRSAVCRRPAAW